MTPLEQLILNTIQDAFPLEERPYKALAELFNKQGSVGSVTEQQVFDAVEGLRNSGVIRRIGGVYDSRRLGFISRLCAGIVPEASLENFAATVNEIPAITHNYVRSHDFNVWFTVIAQSEDEIHAVVDKLCAQTDLHDVHVLSVTKKFKIDTVMTRGKRPNVIAQAHDRFGSAMPVCKQPVAALASHVIARNVVTKQSTEECHPECSVAKSKDLSHSDRVRIRIACTDIPHTLTPYADWGVSVKELREDIANGYMRRFGAILRHQQAGFAFNAMVCFNARESSFGDILAKNPHVSHCYER
ncbi:MAG: Lrp/AsnC family transcriptional regulator, partial [Fibrobacter sp.]|nr:Lrp/AsnC family transcriptional regulator [Fibrobacter sp.]